MNGMELLLCTLALATCIIMACALCSGRGSFLIAGYNMLPPEKKEQYNEKALCRFMGIVLFIIIGSAATAFLGEVFEKPWLYRLGAGIFCIDIVTALICSNICFKKKD